MNLQRMKEAKQFNEKPIGMDQRKDGKVLAYIE